MFGMKEQHRKDYFGFRMSVIVLAGIALVTYQNVSVSARYAYFGAASQYQARLLCERFGLQLVIDDSEDKHGRIVQKIEKPEKYFWIDAAVTSDIKVVKTSDDLELSYKPFARNHIPTANYCIAVLYGKWEAIPCDEMWMPICENASSANLIVMNRWEGNQAQEVCRRFGLHLIRIMDEAKHLDAVTFVHALNIRNYMWIDAYVNLPSGELTTHDGSVVAYRPAVFDVGNDSCIMLNVREHIRLETLEWRTSKCDGGRNVLCEDDETHNLTTIAPMTILQRIDDIEVNILKLQKGHFTLNMSIDLAQDIFDKIQGVLDDIAVNLTQIINADIRGRLTQIILTITDDIANFLINKLTWSGDGVQVVLSAPLLVLNLEKNTLQNLSHGTMMVGPESGFEMPSAVDIFPHLSLNVTLIRVITRFGAEFHHISNMSDQFTTDILSLLFKTESGQDIEVQNATEGIGVWLANRQTPSNETFVGGKYVDTDAATHYALMIKDIKPLHAVKLVLATSSQIFENTTAYVSTQLHGSLSDSSGFQFSSEVNFHGGVASIFLPEGVTTKGGSYNVTFDLLYSQEAEFRVSTTQHRCSYSVDNAYSWQNGGCKVSPKSNVNVTLCFCSKLTTFTTE